MLQLFSSIYRYYFLKERRKINCKWTFEDNNFVQIDNFEKDAENIIKLS